MSSDVDEITELHVARAVDLLVDEFGDQVPQPEIERLVRDSVARLAPSAEVSDFVPTLAYRFARERILASHHSRGTGPLEILFVGLGDTGRGQMAAALMAVRSEGRINAHSAGSTASSTIDPNVVAVMAELDVDLGEAFAKPLSDEVLRAADIVVTMGRSVGNVEIPDETAASTGASETRPGRTSRRCVSSVTTSTGAFRLSCRPCATARRSTHWDR